jgi:hypothetical protein
MVTATLARLEGVHVRLRLGLPRFGGADTDVDKAGSVLKGVRHEPKYEAQAFSFKN